MDRRAAAVSVPVLGGVLGTAALFWHGRNGWTGAPNDCILRGDCFCEAFREGLVRQPANTWSALAFIAVGAWVAWHAVSRKGSGRSLMSRSPSLPVQYAFLLALIGPGTMALHATTTRWGGALDSISMYLLGAFMLVYAAHRMTLVAEPRLWPVWALLAAPLAYTKWFAMFRTEPVFGACIAAAGLAELRLSRGRRPVWLWASFGLFALAFAIWLASHTGGPLCSPYSLLQGHAAWHILTALAGGTLYLHYRSE